MNTKSTYSKEVVEVLLSLLRIALGNESVNKESDKFSCLNINEWYLVRELANRQSVPAIALDGLQALQASGVDVHSQIDEELWLQFLMEWVGVQMHIEQQYEAYTESLRHLAALYAKQGIRMMVLKGYGLSLNYPKPNHRPTGDLDIYLFGKQQEADRLIQSLGIKVDMTHHHHTTFQFEGLYVENHYDFLNIYAHQGNKRIEQKLKWLSFSCKHDDNIPNVYYPTDELNTLFLLRHMGAHFAAERMTLRQLLNWALSPQVEMKEEFKMHDFRQVVNAICNDYLGFGFPAEKVDRHNEERVFDDMINPYLCENLTYWNRLKRWFANRWKNQLFYQENLFATFGVQLWSHIVRPLGHA